MATHKQIELIRNLTSRILAVDVSKLPTKAKAPAPARFTFNPQANAVAAQSVARDVLAKLDAGQFDTRFASNCIDDLMVQARRARA